MPQHGRHIEIRGVVQGVGFRPWVFQLANREGIAGSVRNDPRGVLIDAFGTDEALSRFMAGLEIEAPPAARIFEIVWEQVPFENAGSFSIAESERTGVRQVSVPPDLAICEDCLGELFDPADRRYRYPFINCTNCGPRYSIVQGVPYDRPLTTMRAFRMCSDCQSEYENPSDRRFHAQPNACGRCGPKVSAVTCDGQPIDTADPIRFAARAIRAQLTIAVKGIGGFHLACDASSSSSVRRLRERKHREIKPLAIMVRDLVEAETIGSLTERERELLVSVERPVVLVTRRKDAPIVAEVSGENPLVGLFLAYTPLHHLLIAASERPLVMTSGNIAEEPMVTRNDTALEQLGKIADVFLMHDREIETRADDSVVRVIAGRPTVFRRARGYVPRAVRVKPPVGEPVLAVGAHLKNTFCIATGDAAFPGPHIGDLETVETLRSFEAAIEQMKRFVGVEPKLVAHDLHPGYFSTRYALGLSGVRTLGVQHHHAHVVSAMAEHGLTGTAVGVAYDGTGFGTDGTSWGGEILLASAERFRRFATFRPIALAGGDQAIRHVWRIALAVLDDAFDGAPPLNAIPLFRSVPRRAVDSVRRMIATGLNAPRARGVGRLFDALGSIGLEMPQSRYEGEVAFRWNMAAAGGEDGLYEVVVREGVAPWEIDFRPVIRGAVEDLLRGVDPATVSARFHNTLAATTAEVARAAADSIGDVPIVLSGGCFQNARLAESVIAALDGHRVVMNNEIPPGDGGLALGQAVIADAQTRLAPVIESTEVPLCV